MCSGTGQPSVCRVVGMSVVFVTSDRCRVQANAGDTVVHSFAAQVEAAAANGRRNPTVAWDLSQRRVQAVAEFLAARGVSVTVESAQGKRLPTSTDRRLNRRVEIAWYSSDR